MGYLLDDIESVRRCAAKAATNPALWPETLWRTSELIGSDMTLFEHIDKATGIVTHGFTDRPEIVAATREAYEKHFYAVNPRYDIARARPLHEITHDDLLGDERMLDRHEFYVDFLKPCDLKYFIGSTVADDAEQTVTFSLQRKADRGRVSEEGQRAFAAVLPDIRNAMAMYLRAMHAPPGATLAAAFGRMADPVAVIGEDGRLVFANRAMIDLCAAGDIVAMRDCRLSGARAGIRRALSEAMRTALAGTRSTMASTFSESGPLVVRLSPLAPDQGHEFASRADRLFCLMIDDPARPRWSSVSEAMSLHALTRREATVGLHLSAGMTIDGVALRMNVSRNTVRTHLAQLRDKLGVHSGLAVAAEMRRTVSPFI